MTNEIIFNMEANDTLSKNGEILVKVWFEGNTYKYKSEIKSIGGYYWLSYERKWTKFVALSQLDKEIEQAVKIGAIMAKSKREFLKSQKYKVAEIVAKDFQKKH